jgi:predicted transcriptional regulator
MIKELVEQGYVRMLHTKGRYMVTDKENEVLKKMPLE